MNTMKKMCSAVLVSALLVEMSGCGTILYPDRKGQIDGEIDVGVAVMDGIGLLFYFIPGVIAYAVDFNNGTIYLPKGMHNDKIIKQKFSQNDVEVIKVADGKLDNAQIEKVLEAHVGHAVDMSQVQQVSSNQ
jgi:uncharacterized lipoprotein YehR (DUF1307 family)